MRQARGFTLLEVLVALTLLTLFSITSYRALDAVLTGEQQALAEMARWREIARTFTRIESDLSNAVAGVRDEGALLRGFRVADSEASETSSLGFAFDRALAEDEPAGLQRVGYRLDGNTLLRQTWHENAPASTPTYEARLLKGINKLEWRFLDGKGAWQMDWPALTANSLPLAIEIRLQMQAKEDTAKDSGVTLRRVFRTR